MSTLECVPQKPPVAVEFSVDQEWLDRGRELAKADCDRQFAVGDWLTEGETKWSRKAYAEAATIFSGYSRGTLHVFASVARAVEPLIRNKDLPWAHHAAVARFKGDEQGTLLSHAAAQELSLSSFKNYIRELHPPARPENTPPEYIRLSLPDDVLVAVKAVAGIWEEPIEVAVGHLIEQALEIPDIKKELADVVSS